MKLKWRSKGYQGEGVGQSHAQQRVSTTIPNPASDQRQGFGLVFPNDKIATEKVRRTRTKFLCSATTKLYQQTVFLPCCTESSVAWLLTLSCSNRVPPDRQWRSEHKSPSTAISVKRRRKDWTHHIQIVYLHPDNDRRTSLRRKRARRTIPDTVRWSPEESTP